MKRKEVLSYIQMWNMTPAEPSYQGVLPNYLQYVGTYNLQNGLLKLAKQGIKKLAYF